MRLVLNDRVLAIVAESPEDIDVLASIRAKSGRVFQLYSKNADECRFVDLGRREFACREPINIVWTDPHLDPAWRPISNLAPTDFVLDGRPYASVEGFWQGLKFPSEEDRRRLASLSGRDAMEAGRDAPQTDEFIYEGSRIPVGRPEHWSLMRRACLAKFTQHPPSREALLATGDRYLTHRVRRDSRSIPGAIMAEIWMRIRSSFRGPRGRAADA